MDPSDKGAAKERQRKLRAEYAQAELRERGRWEAVKGRHPGQREHDPKIWSEWIAAVDEMQRVAMKLRAAAFGEHE